MVGNDVKNNERLVLLGLVLLVTAWGILGWLDLPNKSQAGFSTDAEHNVTFVTPGSPAEKAGLEPGMRITHFDYIPVEDASALAQKPRKKIGDSQRVKVLDQGEVKRLRITYRGLTGGQLTQARLASIVGFCFLLFPVAAWYRKRDEATRVLTFMGIGLSLALIVGPSISGFSARALMISITSLFVMLGVPALLHFLLLFPQRRPMLDRPYGKPILYLPVFLLWLLIAYRLLLTPASTSSLNMLTNAMVGVIMTAYLLLSVFQILRNYSRTDRAVRKKLRLNGMLLGTVLAVIPVTIAHLVEAFSPHAGLPAQDYYFISLVLIPWTWSRSASTLQ